MRLSDERGAIFIHVAIVLVILLGFIAYAADFGMLMVARNQAQNSADAAALAGAHALAFDGAIPGDRWDRARNVAWNTGFQNHVWGEAAGVVPKSPVWDDEPCASKIPEACVRVDVFRNGTNGGNLMPTWFANMFGVTTQGTRAMAIAEAAPASGTNCLKPWLIPDRFTNITGNPNQFDTGDVYVRPTMNEDGSMNYGTGYTPADAGTELVLKPALPNDTIAPGNFYAIDDPMFDVNGGNDYRDAIASCRLTKSIGDIVSIKDGNMIGPTHQGFYDLLAAHGGEATVVIGLFDPAAYAALDRQTGNQPIEIVNMLAFKLTMDSMQGNRITGTIVGAPSSMATACSTWPCPTSAGLVSVIRLVR